MVCKAAIARIAPSALALRVGIASAQTATVDPSYGRIEGDIEVAFGAGAVIAPRGPRAEGELRFRYLETAGLLATYEDAGAFGAAAEPPRALILGLELRPLFLFRWLEGHETGRARFDLAVDSIGFEMSAVWQQPSGAGFGSQRGFEAALAVEVPVLERASGPWIGLRGGLRWSERALGSGAVVGADDWQAIVAFTLAWHQVLAVHVVDWGDRAAQ